jgi:hypothetical protein
MTDDGQNDRCRARSSQRGTGRLSSKLLWLTILFVMIAEVLIFVPSVANFRMTLAAGKAQHRRRGSVVVRRRQRDGICRKHSGRRT